MQWIVSDPALCPARERRRVSKMYATRETGVKWSGPCGDADAVSGMYPYSDLQLR